jgi:hypothetical protein
VGGRADQYFGGSFGPWILDFSRIRDRRLFKFNILCLNEGMNGKTFGGQQFAAPAERPCPGRGSVPPRAGGRAWSRVPGRNPLNKHQDKSIGDSEKVRGYVRPHRGLLPREKESGSAAAIGENGSNWFGRLDAQTLF